MVEAVGRGRGLYDLQEARVKLADQEKFAALLVPGTDFGDPIGAGPGEKGKRALTIGWQTFQAIWSKVAPAMRVAWCCPSTLLRAPPRGETAPLLPSAKRPTSRTPVSCGRPSCTSLRSSSGRCFRSPGRCTSFHRGRAARRGAGRRGGGVVRRVRAAVQSRENACAGRQSSTTIVDSGPYRFSRDPI